MKPYLRFEQRRVQIPAHTLKNSNESYRRGPGRGKHDCGGLRFTSQSYSLYQDSPQGTHPAAEPATSHLEACSSLLSTPSHPNPLAIFNSPRIRGFQRHHFVHFVAYIASLGLQWQICSWFPFRAMPFVTSSPAAQQATLPCFLFLGLPSSCCPRAFAPASPPP